MTATAQARVIPLESRQQPVKLRKCYQCGAGDRETGTFDIETRDGQEIERPVHYVQPEVVYVDRAEDKDTLVRRLKLRGFTPLVFQGRTAMQRMMCVECLNLQQVANQLNAEYRRAAKHLERRSEAQENFYYALCDMGGE